MHKNKSAAGRRNFDSAAYLKNIKKRKCISVILLFLILPIIFCVFYFVLEQKHYIIMSIVILACLMLPFFVVFERRRPKARDVVLIASMTAFTVAGNVICTHSIPLHAGTALVIISGITLGPEAGFLVGALGRLVCNIFDGQGPWTPWQMSAWGIMGFLSGITFNKIDIHSTSVFDESTEKKSSSFKLIAGPVMCIIVAELTGYIIYLFAWKDKDFAGWWLYLFGALGLLAGVLIQKRKLPADVITMTAFTIAVTFIIYGGMLNFANLLMQHALDPTGTPISMEALKAIYITGVPYDMQHALGAAFCIFIFGETMIRKIERVKIKYGIL